MVKTKTTHLVQIVHDQNEYNADGWTPWKNCSANLEETALLAVNKFMRESGMSRSRGWEPMTLQVHVAPSTPVHKNGRPKSCTVFAMRVSPKEMTK